MKNLNQSEISEKLKALPKWSIKSNTINRNIKFKDFIEAFSFMTQIAIIAEKLNHHPDWKNCYNQLEISLTTHDAGGLTELDFELANHIEKLLSTSEKA